MPFIARSTLKSGIKTVFYFLEKDGKKLGNIRSGYAFMAQKSRLMHTNACGHRIMTQHNELRYCTDSGLDSKKPESKTEPSTENLDIVSLCPDSEDLLDEDIIKNLDTVVNTDMTKWKLPKDQRSSLDPCDEDVSYVAPPLSPTFNFAAYADNSELLQKLLALGVDFYKLERMRKVPFYILQLDFEKDIQPYLKFLIDKGVPNNMLGRYITKNPFIFQEDMDNLEVRINYLESKRFTPEMIGRIININPKWLSHSTVEIDQALGYFQKEFNLTGPQVRSVAHQEPAIITRHKLHLVKITFCIREEMGFNEYECKKLVLTVPRLWGSRKDRLWARFNIAHNEMNIPHELLVKDPSPLLTREFRLRERHLFLKALGKNQYNPKEQGYIAPLTLVRGTDADFCRNVAKTSVETYNAFLKSL